MLAPSLYFTSLLFDVDHGDSWDWAILDDSKIKIGSPLFYNNSNREVTNKEGANIFTEPMK